MYVDELSYFLNCVNKKKNTMNNVYQGTKTLQIALSIMKSGKTNRVVKL